MNLSFVQNILKRRFLRPEGAVRKSLKRLAVLLEIPAPDAPQLIRRITIMERDIMLPIKAAGIVMLLHSFYISPWIGSVSSELEIAVEAVQAFLLIYSIVNALYAALLSSMRRLPLALIEWSVFAIGLIDAIFLSALMLVTGGFESYLYWLFLLLIIRGAVSVPRGTAQVVLNLTTCACYLFSGIIAISVAANLDEHYPSEEQAEPLLLRLLLLLLMTVCCYGVQVLFERQRKALEEAREFALREGQLRSAGRLAAEFAHQIKNPLAIINNAAFSLRRALKNGHDDALEQISIIQEEVDHSDRIITQVMGYAQLSEGRVEKLSVVEELDSAIDQVFPRGTKYTINIHRDYAGDFPPVLAQRLHLRDVFVNLLQNAREALDPKPGNIHVSAQCLSDYSIEILIQDDGPGVPPEKREKIFEAYYTTKEKGTGLGLATVRHNLELYGGSVKVESELGKGARFIVIFPARTFVRLERTA